jgi:hypothetical protein
VARRERPHRIHGRDPEPGYWRVYEDLGFRSYLRVAEADMASTENPVTDEELLRRSVVRIRPGSRLERTRVDTQRVQAGFLEGTILERLSSFPSETARPGPYLARQETMNRRCIQQQETLTPKCETLSGDRCPSGSHQCGPKEGTTKTGQKCAGGVTKSGWGCQKTASGPGCEPAPGN